MNGYIRQITQEERLKNEVQSCKDILYRSELIGCHESQIRYWKNRVENAERKLADFNAAWSEDVDEEAEAAELERDAAWFAEVEAQAADEADQRATYNDALY